MKPLDAQAVASPDDAAAPVPGRRPPSLELILLGLQVVFLIWTRLVQPPIYVDDAYIHFRNALNLATGQGLLYNPGQWVIGTTSPVYAVWLGILHATSGLALPALAKVLNFLADVGIMLLSLAWLRRFGLPLAWRHAIVLIGSAEVWRMFFSSGGMELSVFVLMILGLFEFLERRRWLAAGLVLGVMGWVRPEAAVVWVVATLGLAHLRRRRELARMLGTALAVAALTALCLVVVYGTVIPLSVTAKLEAPWFNEPVTSIALDFLFRLGSLLPVNGLTGYVPPMPSMADLTTANFVSLLELALVLIGARWIGKRGFILEAWALGGFMGGFFLLYAVVNPHIFYWYYIPFVFCAQILAGVGVWAMVEAALSWVGRRRPAWRRQPVSVAALGGFFVLSMLTAGHNAALWQYSGDSALQGLAFRHPGFDTTTREARYVVLGKLLREWFGPRPDVRIGCMEIGIFGYTYGGPILDCYGLVSPEVLAVRDPAVVARLPFDARKFPDDVFLLERPPIVMSVPEHWTDRSASFDALYELVKPPGVDMYLFVRRDCKELLPDGVGPSNP